MGPRSRLAEASRGPAGGSRRMKWHPFFMKSRLSYLVRLKQARGRRKRWRKRKGDRSMEKRERQKKIEPSSPLSSSYLPLFSSPSSPPASVCFTLLLRFTQKQPSPPSLFAFTATPINPISSPAISPSTYPLTWLWVQSALLTLCQVWHNSPSLLSPSL